MGVTLLARLNGREYRFDDGREIKVGRDPAADVVSANPIVSREHAVLRPDANGWVLEDRGSRGGIFVGNERVSRLAITTPVTVRLGDPDQGDELHLQLAQVVAPPPPAPPAPVGPPAAPPPEGPAAQPVRLGRHTGTYRTDT